MFKDPFIISSIILAFSFIFILICNQKLKSKAIKLSFLVLAIIFLILLLVYDTSYVYELLKCFITYFWYPNYLLFVSTVLISIVILIYTILNKKLKIYEKIANYLLFCISFPCYITFQRLDIDPKIYSSLYEYPSIMITRIVTISFMVWLIITLIFKLVSRRSRAK